MNSRKWNFVEKRFFENCNVESDGSQSHIHGIIDESWRSRLDGVVVCTSIHIIGTVSVCPSHFWSPEILWTWRGSNLTFWPTSGSNNNNNKKSEKGKRQGRAIKSRILFSTRYLEHYFPTKGPQFTHPHHEVYKRRPFCLCCLGFGLCSYCPTSHVGGGSSQ